MKGKVKCLFLSLIGILVISLVVLSGCAGNDSAVPTFSAFEEPLPPPVEVTVEQLYQEYMADEAAAEAKYKGKGLLFTEVEVEEVVGRTYMMGEALGASTDEFVKEYFTSGFAKFRLQNFGIMQNIEEGYVLNIVGECRGLFKGFVIIDDCWVESVIGDIGTGGEVEFY